MVEGLRGGLSTNLELMRMMFECIKPFTESARGRRRARQGLGSGEDQTQLTRKDEHWEERIKFSLLTNVTYIMSPHK